MQKRTIVWLTTFSLLFSLTASALLAQLSGFSKEDLIKYTADSPWERFDDEQYNIVTLPCRFAGLGLRSARSTAPAAFFGGWAAALALLQTKVPAAANQIVAQAMLGPRRSEKQQAWLQCSHPAVGSSRAEDWQLLSGPKLRLTKRACLAEDSRSKGVF